MMDGTKELRWLAVGLVVVSAWGCDRSDGGDNGTTGGSSSTSKPSATGSATKITPSAAATATAAATAKAAPSLAKMFNGDVPDAKAQTIFNGGKASGVIVLLPKEFKPGSGTYGDGYIAFSPHSAIAFGVTAVPGITKNIPKLTDTQLKILCYPAKVDKIVWEPQVETTYGRDDEKAIVWRGKGIHIGTKTPWGAYAISTVLKMSRRVKGCSMWDLEHPEASKGALLALKSLRIGIGGVTDPGYP